MRQEVIEEKDFIIDSGEIPEVAFYSSLYFLTKDPQGPQLTLTLEEITFLKKAVIEGYKRIILRDLNPKMRGESKFRGMERAIINYKRLKKYAEKERFDITYIIPQLAQAMSGYIKEELKDEYLKKHSLRTLNCTKKEWEWFAKELKLDPTSLIPNIEDFFKRTPLSFEQTIKLFKKYSP